MAVPILSFRTFCAVAQWIRLRLPFCHPGFESQAHHLCFYPFKFEFKLWHVEKTKINSKRGRDWPIFLKKQLFVLPRIEQLTSIVLKIILLSGRPLTIGILSCLELYNQERWCIGRAVWRSEFESLWSLRFLFCKETRLKRKEVPPFLINTCVCKQK